VIGAFEHQDPSGARGGQVVGGARADDASPNDDDVGGPVQDGPLLGCEDPVASPGAITQSSPR
jgi:hypothetical protein